MKEITLVRIATLLCTSGLFLASIVFLKYFVFETLIKKEQDSVAAMVLTLLTGGVIACCIVLIITVFKDKN